MCEGVVSLNMIHHPQSRAVGFVLCQSREVRIRQLQARYGWGGGFSQKMKTKDEVEIWTQRFEFQLIILLTPNKDINAK